MDLFDLYVYARGIHTKDQLRYVLQEDTNVLSSTEHITLQPGDIRGVTCAIAPDMHNRATRLLHVSSTPFTHPDKAPPVTEALYTPQTASTNDIQLTNPPPHPIEIRKRQVIAAFTPMTAPEVLSIRAPIFESAKQE